MQRPINEFEVLAANANYTASLLFSPLFIFIAQIIVINELVIWHQIFGQNFLAFRKQFFRTEQVQIYYSYSVRIWWSNEKFRNGINSDLFALCFSAWS